MSSNRVSQASLILDDGTVYKGKLFGASECVAGEVGKFLKLFLGFIVRSLTHFRHMVSTPRERGPFASICQYDTDNSHK